MSPFQICSTTHHFHVYLSILTNDLTFTALSQSPKELIPGHCWHTMRCKSTSICEAEQAGKVSPRVMWGAMTRKRAVGLPSNLRKGDRKKRLCFWEMQAFWRHTRKKGDNMLETWAWRQLATTISSLTFLKLHQIFRVNHKAAKITNPRMALQGLLPTPDHLPHFHVLCSQFDVFCVEAHMLHQHWSPP